MKFLNYLILIAITIGLSFMPAFAQKFTILSVGDTHSNIAPGAPRDSEMQGTTGGIARAASIIMTEKMSGDNVVLLHAGDVFIGDLVFNATFGVAEFNLMLELGFDAMTLGNHEFDIYSSTIQEAAKTAFAEKSFPLLSANMICDDANYNDLKSFVKKYIVKEFDGFKVGVIGLTTPETNFIAFPAPVSFSTEISEILMASLVELKEVGCNYIILLSHMGHHNDVEIAKSSMGIDLIIGGHDHFAFDTPQYIDNAEGKPVPIIQCGANYQYIGKTIVDLDKEDPSFTYTLMELDENVPELPQIKSAVDQITGLVESTYGFPYLNKITTATDYFEEKAKDLTNYGDKDTPISNLVTDALRAFKNTDIAITSGGLTSRPLYKGPVTAADLYRMIGYGFNEVNGLGYKTCTFDISGEALAAGLEFGVSDIDVHDEYFIQVSGMSYIYDSNLEMPRVHTILVNGEPLEPGKIYSCTANEFAVGFLQFLQIPVENIQVFPETEFMIISSIIGGMEEISPVVDGRVKNSAKTGVEIKNDNDDYFTLFPNPANETVSLISNIDTEINQIQVTDIIGNTVISHNLAGNMFSNSIQLKTNSLPVGLYFCKIFTNDKIYLKRLVIAR